MFVENLSRISVAALLCLTLACGTAVAQVPPAKIVVHDQTQLPRFSYPMTIAPSALLVADDATFAPFAAAVGADIDRTLRDYDIQDSASKRDLIQTKLGLQLLAHDDDGARASVTALREAESKPASKLLMARLTLVALDAAAQAKAHPGTTAASYVPAIDAAAVQTLPWDVVQDAIKQAYGGEQGMTRDALIGFVSHDLDPIAQKTGTLDAPSARELIAARVELLITLPLFAADAAVLKAYIAAHNVAKPDIWRARDVTLKPAQIKAPVVIGIWDTGVDPGDYPGRMYVDAAGRHGLALNDDGTASSSLLYPLPAATLANYKHYITLMDGLSDLQSAIDSPEAAAFRTYERSLSADQATTFLSDLAQITEYVHGSHVAGIAALGNPGARIAVARFNDNLDDFTFAPSIAWTERMTAGFARIGAYLRANHVRVVNMSWLDNVTEFEHWFARTGTTSDPQTRKQEAQALFALWRSAIEHVIASNPGTLFVVSAGNDDNNASFAVEVPAALSYPNMMTVGAVNQAGDATSFTSYGPTVVVYADGFQVPSKVPGGYIIKASGTSMAAPNVTNLAAKLFALDPALTPVQVRALIIRGATLSDDGKRKLIDPKRSIALLAAMKHARVATMPSGASW